MLAQQGTVVLMGGNGSPSELQAAADTYCVGHKYTRTQQPNSKTDEVQLQS
jgi:hypothetical protein